jgi:PAS domain S-box-containing protein
MTDVRVLLVEGEALVAQDVESMLKRMGYGVPAIACSGEEAVRRAAETRPDLVLMDVELRGAMDGVEAAEQIQARFDIPVVYLTAHADDETLRRARITGPFGYLLKPLEARDLRSVIEMALYKHEMERKLEESEELYRAISELTTDFAYAGRFEADGTFVREWVTGAFTRITGFTPDEVWARGGWQSLVYPDDVPIFLQYLQALLSNQPGVSEYRIATRSGETRWLRDYGRPVWDEAQGRVVRIIGAAQDITERKVLEGIWRKYEFIANTSRDFMTLIGKNYTYEAANESYCRAHNKTEEEIIEHTVAGVWGEERYLTQIKGHLDKCFAGDEVHYQAWFEFAALGPRCLDVAYYPYCDGEGTVTHVVVVSRDITEHKRMEQSLLHAERLAAMGRLAAALAHEIKNPLQSMSINMELALDFPLQEEERQEHLQAVQRDIERLMALTGRILDFARPSQIERQPTSVAEVVRYALALAGKQLQRSHIRLSVDLPDDLPPVSASRDHLAQVFLNLIINAIEAMPAGGELSIAARLAGEQLELAFTDSGPGISPEALATIFEPFYTEKEGGTGLGLTVSRSIIQQHGGTITAGNVASGAVFTITLPVAPPDNSRLTESK